MLGWRRGGRDSATLQHYDTLWDYWYLFSASLKKSFVEALEVLEEVGRGRGRAEREPWAVLQKKKKKKKKTLPHIDRFKPSFLFSLL